MGGFPTFLYLLLFQTVAVFRNGNRGRNGEREIGQRGVTSRIKNEDCAVSPKDELARNVPLMM